MISLLSLADSTLLTDIRLGSCFKVRVLIAIRRILAEVTVIISFVLTGVLAWAPVGA